MTVTKQISATILLGLSVTLLSTSNAEALDFTFTKLVDTSTPIPGGGGVFRHFDYFTPALDNGTVAFWADSRNAPLESDTYSQGIYTYRAGTLTKVVDTSTLIPGSSNTFSYLGQPSIDKDGNIAFWGALSNSQKTDYENSGIYTSTGGTLNRIADKTTLVPENSGRRFASFNRQPSIDAGTVVFSGMDNGRLQAKEGIYTSSGGVLNPVVVQGTPMPGTNGTFTSFPSAAFIYPNAAIDNGNIVFIGQVNSDRPGVYTSINGVLEKVADKNTPIFPYGPFNDFGSPSIDDHDVAFIGADAYGSSGIYTDTSGVLTRISGGSNIPAIDNGSIVFSASTNGLYTTLGGSLTKVLNIGDSLDGKLVNRIYSGREALSGNSFTFQARFIDGSQGIYMAEAQSIQSVPTPALLPGLLAFGAQIWKRRRQ